jgi:2-polyprenyl-3-methyl-5-hydroxy-6-metoxy-1,4-benzoquinol methylase
MIPIKAFIDILLRPRAKRAFIAGLQSEAKVLDIGCGNESDHLFKAINSQAIYYGIDICPQPQAYKGEIYIQTNPVKFNADVQAALLKVDTAISAHNLEHCDDYRTLVNFLAQAPTLTQLFLSFPSEISKTLPKSRFGSLNFFQDSTHREVPDVTFITKELEAYGWEISFISNPYRPFLAALIGLLWWPIFKVSSIESPLYGTYSFYGFETVIWCSRSLPR